MSMGDTIKKYRKLKGLTQKELGEKIGRTQRTIQAYEKNEVLPPLTIIKNLANILGISNYELMQGGSPDEKLENLKKLPTHDEYDLTEIAKELNVNYSNLNQEDKKQINELYKVINKICEKNHI